MIDVCFICDVRGCCRLPPSLIWFHDVLGFTAEAMLVAICTTGWLLAATAACGAAHPLVFTALWLLYLSFVSLGGSFIEYGCVSQSFSHRLHGYLGTACCVVWQPQHC